MVETHSGNTAQFHDHLMQNITAGILVLDDQGIVTSANKTAARILGYDPEKLIGHSYHEFWPQDLPPANRMGYGESRIDAAELRLADGRSVPVQLTVTPISDHIPSTTMIAFTSLGDADQINAALAHTQRMAGIGILTASVAHELNTPLSIIAATCSNLQHEVEDNTLSMEQLIKYIDMIEQSAWRSARIVEVLRNYSYDAEMQVSVTDLNMIVEDALTLVRHQFRGEYNIQIEKDLADNLRTTVCDHNGLTQVLINLLINARDAMIPQGRGKVTIKSWVMPAQPAHLNGTAHSETHSTPEMYAISVADTGTGVSSDIINKIYEPFFTTKPKGKGTGLGLYIAQRIVSQHNGRIWVENNADGGATFTLAISRQPLA